MEKAGQSGLELSLALELQGPVGGLVATLDEPPGPLRGAALVCHPHPLHGGSLRNTIVVRTARALRRAGLATLRFNFRGVEGSAGRHDGTAEVEDAAAVASTLMARYPGLPLWGAGYSFGSRVIAELAQREGVLERFLLVAFPCALYDPGFLARLRQPGLILMGENDEFGTLAVLRRRVPRLPPRIEAVEIAGADHFFRGRTPLVEEAVGRYAARP